MERHLQAFSHPLSAILTLHSWSAVISTIDYSKTSRSRRYERSTPPPMKNERHQPNTPTETRTIQSRTQIAKLHSHLASNDSTGYRIPILSQARGSQNTPPQRIPQGSGEVLERDRGSQSPVSFQPPPRGTNKIYKSDVVFPMEESKTNDISHPQLPYTPPRGINKIYTYDAVFPIGEARKKVPKPPAASLYTPRKNAIAPRRRRMTPSAARERST